MVLMLYLHPSLASKIIKAEHLKSDPSIPITEFIDCFGNRCGLVSVQAGRMSFWNDAIVEDNGIPDVTDLAAPQVAVDRLPLDTLQYLLSSRYCEVDKLGPIAWDLFHQTPTGWGRVQAICDWVNNHINFDYKHARCTRTAYETYIEGIGVCRDYTHLAIAFCRCMHIPARYATGYLGDICTPPTPLPMDFSSWMEVFLGDRWYAFDPRHNTPRVGRILMAIGRDAADVALATTFGQNNLEKFEVWTDEISEAELAYELHFLPNGQNSTRAYKPPTFSTASVLEL